MPALLQSMPDAPPELSDVFEHCLDRPGFTNVEHRAAPPPRAGEVCADAGGLLRGRAVPMTRAPCGRADPRWPRQWPRVARITKAIFSIQHSIPSSV